jgi:hypothetical protein
MGTNKLNWNITLEKGLEISHNKIIEILREKNKPISLSELIDKLKQRTKKIKLHTNKKHNCLLKYIKDNYGGIIKFLDSYNMYGLIYSDTNNSIKVILLEDQLEKEITPIKAIINESEWVFI